ncbi:MAG: helix-turn-helix domain-containing protein [Firmicutes bacterium]|nr:helix-turn-helix domain-containing protein [Bacillota bacterium]
MEYTIADLLKQSDTTLWEYATPGIDPSQRAIRSCFVHELPMEAFVRPGELVLTSAVGCEENPLICRQIVEESYSAGAAGVVFSFPVDHAIPREAIVLAEIVDLPLIKIDWQINFTDIQSRVTKAVLASRMADYVDLQSRMFNAYFEGKDLVSAIGLIADTFHTEAAAADRTGKMLCRTEGFQEKSLVYEIEINDVKLGELWIQSEEEMTDELGAIVRQYVSYPLTLWFNRRRVEAVTRQRLKNDFVLRICRETMTDDLVREAGFLHFTLHGRFIALMVEPIAKTRHTQHAVITNAGEIIDDAVDLSEDMDLQVITGEERGRFIAFLEYPAGGHAAVNGFLDAWIRMMKRRITDIVVHVGISQAFEGEKGFKAAFEESLIATAYCDSSSDQRIYFEEARKLRIMSAVSAQPFIGQDAKLVLKGLFDYDKNGGSMELMKTLAVYFRCNSNTSLTARELHIHRQSLLARLQKIEDLTGMSLKSHDDRFVLEVYSRLFLNY